MMGPGFGMMGSPVFGMVGGLGVGFLSGFLGLIFGVIVTNTFMLNSKPREHTTWGPVIAMFSMLSIR